MHFLLLLLRRSHHHHHYHHQQWRTLLVRDRGLDHAVEREKNLKPILNIKNLIKSEPSKSIPLNILTQSKDTLQIPTRPIEFLRKYPSIFQEFYPGNTNIHPHIKLTPEIISLDSDEDLFYRSVSYKEDIANRVLKLLMIGKINKIPFTVVDKLKWDLGLCDSFAKMIVPEYPDYFYVNSNDAMLELVCWSHELAVSFMQKQAMKCGNNEDDLLVNNFGLKYSNGFEMDKKYKKWIDDWQKLPYVSPYENAMHLGAKSDEGDKWAVAILHEILSLCVGKKAERDSLLLIGEWLGLRGRFKRALMLHPGIFYVSSKIGTHTVVLKEGYKRGMLIQRSPLMEMRYQYVHLMNTVAEDKKSIEVQKKARHDVNEDLKEADSENEEEEEDDDEDDEDSNDVSDDDIDNEARNMKPSRRLNLKTRIDDRKPFATSASSGRHQNRAEERTSRRSSWRAENSGDQDAPARYEDRKPFATSLRTSSGRYQNRDVERTSRRTSWRAENNGEQDAPTRYGDKNPFATSLRTSSGGDRAVERASRRSSWRAENNSKQDAPTSYEGRKLLGSSLRTPTGRSPNKAKERTSRPSRRPEINDDHYAHQRSSNKLDLRRNRGRPEQKRTPTP